LGALAEAVKAYISVPSSYLEALTAVVNDVSALYESVSCLLTHLPIAWMYLMRELIQSGVTVKEIAKEGKCPNSNKCKTASRKERLDWAASVLRLVPDVLEVVAARGYPVLASGRGCRLLRTHWSECKLF
jgi:hypothetical protein